MMRRILTDWARRGGGYVIEDDYDSEFRYDKEPVGALQGLAPEQVFLLGTASKALAPAVRLGTVARTSPAQELRTRRSKRPRTASRLPRSIDRRGLAEFVLTTMEGAVMQANADFAPQSAAATVYKVLESAVANAEGTDAAGFDPTRRATELATVNTVSQQLAGKLDRSGFNVLSRRARLTTISLNNNIRLSSRARSTRTEIAPLAPVGFLSSASPARFAL